MSLRETPEHNGQVVGRHVLDDRSVEAIGRGYVHHSFDIANAPFGIATSKIEIKRLIAWGGVATSDAVRAVKVEQATCGQYPPHRARGLP